MTAQKRTSYRYEDPTGGGDDVVVTLTDAWAPPEYLSLYVAGSMWADTLVLVGPDEAQQGLPTNTEQHTTEALLKRAREEANKLSQRAVLERLTGRPLGRGALQTQDLIDALCALASVVLEEHPHPPVGAPTVSEMMGLRYRTNVPCEEPGCKAEAPCPVHRTPQGHAGE